MTEPSWRQGWGLAFYSLGDIQDRMLKIPPRGSEIPLEKFFREFFFFFLAIIQTKMKMTQTVSGDWKFDWR